jgi:hypothetical protein
MPVTGYANCPVAVLDTLKKNASIGTHLTGRFVIYRYARSGGAVELHASSERCKLGLDTNRLSGCDGELPLERPPAANLGTEYVRAGSNLRGELAVRAGNPNTFTFQVDRRSG